MYSLSIKLRVLGLIVSPFGKFYLLDKSDNLRVWLGNLAIYSTDKIYQKVEQPGLSVYRIGILGILKALY